MFANDIIKLLKSGSADDIQNNLIPMLLKMSKYCNKVMGHGIFGKVIISEVGKTMPVTIGNDKFNISVVTKQKLENTSYCNFYKIKDTLLIAGDLSITTECIMLIFLSKYWYEGVNVHLPFMLGFGNCDNNPTEITNIILERCGLQNKIVIDKSNYVSSVFETLVPSSESHLETCYGLFEYIVTNYDDKLNCKLPNDQIVYVPELIDNFCIFFLFMTHVLWTSFKLTLEDQHLNNIFVHWVDDNSRCGKVSMNVSHLYYEIEKNKYLKVNTHGIIFKIGDVGLSTMIPQENVILCGDIPTKNNLDKLLTLKNKRKLYFSQLFQNLNMFPIEILQHVKMHNYILSNNQLKQMKPYTGFKQSIHDLIPLELDVLKNVYDKYIVDKPKTTNSAFIMENVLI